MKVLLSVIMLAVPCLCEYVLFKELEDINRAAANSPCFHFAINPECILLRKISVFIGLQNTRKS